MTKQSLFQEYKVDITYENKTMKFILILQKHHIIISTDAEKAFGKTISIHVINCRKTRKRRDPTQPVNHTFSFCIFDTLRPC